MKSTISGKRFCITGALAHYDRKGAQRAILDAGGEVTKSVGPGTDFLVVGARAGKKLAQAHRLGIPVIEEADLEAFLLGDVVEVEDIVTSGVDSLESLIGEVRGVLDGPPTAATWSRLVELADGCAPDRLDAFVDYLDPQVARWSLASDARWVPSPSDHGVAQAPKRWLQETPYGELRVAPQHWLIEMLSGHNVSKHTLVRAIHLHGMKANARMLAEILSRPALTNLRWLDLSQCALSNVFWQRLRALPSLRTLERLRLSSPTDRDMKAIEGHHHLESLRELILETTTSTAVEPTARLLRASLAQGVTSLVIQGAWRSPIMKRLEDPVCMPSLETLTFAPKRHDHVPLALDEPVSQRVDRFVLRVTLELESQDAGALAEQMTPIFALWTQGVEVGPSHLDVSGLRFMGASVEVVREALSLVFRDWEMPPATRTLSLGSWWSDALEETLGRRGVEVERGG